MNSHSSPSEKPTITPIPRWLYMLRWIPRGLPARWRIAERLIRWGAPTGPVQVRLEQLKLHARTACDPIAAHLIADGIYDPDTCAVIKKSLRTDGIFIDVGANVGAMALRAAKSWCHNGRVIAIEASPTVFQFLKTNTELNSLSNLTPLNFAVTHKDGETVHFFDAPDAKAGMGSLADRFDRGSVQVTTVTLDSIARTHALPHVDVIKVDVEGFELGVFQGATTLLQQVPAPVIVFEFGAWAENRPAIGVLPGAAQRCLIEHGFKLQTVRDFLAQREPGTQVMESGAADLVATRMTQT